MKKFVEDCDKDRKGALDEGQLAEGLNRVFARPQGFPVPQPERPDASPPRYGSSAGAPSGSGRGTEHHTPPGPVLQPDDDWPRETQEP